MQRDCLQRLEHDERELRRAGQVAQLQRKVELLQAVLSEADQMGRG